MKLKFIKFIIKIYLPKHSTIQEKTGETFKISAEQKPILDITACSLMHHIYIKSTAEIRTTKFHVHHQFPLSHDVAEHIHSLVCAHYPMIENWT